MLRSLRLPLFTTNTGQEAVLAASSMIAQQKETANLRL
jgi:hypothetical protein